ncbi:MAG: tryptophan synthase subunit alpha [Bacteroidales bacterium]|nr:tryptophan synthase subunit alpha [Bacteroidales bacterium]
MNRIDELFLSHKSGMLSVYFTAGFPEVDLTREIINNLAKAGVDMIEIGIPFSDPLADGPVIQKSSTTALRNGISMNLLFRQLEGIRETVDIPLILMGYLNPVLKFGMEEFCRHCFETGIDGAIIPDLPPEIYQQQYSEMFKKYGLYNILLICPQTDPQRIRFIDSLTDGFIYMVSSSSVTGIKGSFMEEQRNYFRKIKDMNLSHPLMIGFGISNHETFSEVCKTANGAIIGSAFIKMIEEKGTDYESIKNFVKGIRNNK